MDLAQLRAAQASGAAVLDVREPHETAGGALPGSLLIPLAEVLADPDRVAADRVVVVCARGFRAQRAAVALRERGVDAVVLVGGLSEWQR
ncbi:MAG: rhodanese-like domain-containing protein [Microbacterium arborescens]